MIDENRRGARRLVMLGAGGIVYGLLVGPVINAVFDLEFGPAFHVICIALGMLAVVCGLIRLKQWAD